MVWLLNNKWIKGIKTLQLIKHNISIKFRAFLQKSISSFILTAKTIQTQNNQRNPLIGC